MRNKLCLAAGAAAILLTAMPAAAQRPRVAGSSPAIIYNRMGGTHRIAFVHHGFCFGHNRICSANRRGRGRGFGFGFGFGGGLIGYDDGGLIEDPESLRDQGFFADTGNSWRENGRAVYDYDRGYPYDWYRDAAPGGAEPPPPLAQRPMVRCEISWVPGARKEPSAVRVCRGGR